MFLSIDLDDFEGNFCGLGKNPLQKAIISGIEHGPSELKPPPSSVDTGRGYGGA